MLALAGGAIFATAAMSGGEDGHNQIVAREGRSAPINHAAILGASAATDQSRLPTMEATSQVEIIGKKDSARIAILDPAGEVFFESDPTRQLTIISKGSVVPSVTVREATDDVMELRIRTEIGIKGDQAEFANGPEPAVK